MKRLLLLPILLVWIVGCAGVEVTKLGEKNAYKEGVRFYRSYPYVLISRAEKDATLQARTIFLPKMDEEYVIKIKSGWGTVNASFDLTDGWNLTKFGDSRDSKIPETINALSSLLKEATAAATLERKEKEIPKLEPGLYRYDFGSDGFVKGLTPVLLFKEVIK